MAELASRREMQIFQTVTVRLKEGVKGPPASYSEDEKKCYMDFEKEILENRKNGVSANYSFPNDYD